MGTQSVPKQGKDQNTGPQIRPKLPFLDTGNLSNPLHLQTLFDVMHCCTRDENRSLSTNFATKTRSRQLLPFFFCWF